MDENDLEPPLDSVKGAVAFEILKHISDYPYDLYKIKFKTIVKELLNIDFLKFVQYMEHRIKQPSTLTQVKYAKTQSDSISIFTRENIWALDQKDI